MKHTPLIVLLTMTFLELVSCDSLINQFGLISEQQINAAKERLNVASQYLPTIPGSVLIGSIEGTDSGQVAECAGVYISRLFATNELSFQEVLDQYTSSLQSAGWQLNVVTDYGRTFEKSGEPHLEISDNYRFLAFDQTKVREGQSKFKTLFLVDLRTPVIPDVPPAKCR